MSWRVALRLGRVSNLPTVWTNALAGVILAGAVPSAPMMAALLVSMSLFYVGGMYLNDAFDREIDAVERPERPIPAGEVSARTVTIAGFAILALALVALVAATGTSGGAHTLAALAGGAALAAAIVAYNLRHKGVTTAPLVMALCRALVYVTAGLAATGTVSRPLLAGAFALLCYVSGLTYVAAQENLREPRNLWPLAVLAVPFVYGLATSPGVGAGIVALAALTLWTIHALSFVMRREGRDVPGAVVRLIAGISLLDALLIADQGFPLAAAAASAGAVLTRLLQRSVPGT